MREIIETEIWKLKECIQALSEYHNKVSTYFKGYYPRRPYETTLEMFADDMKEKISRIAVIEDNDKIIGFCKVNYCNGDGKLDYLMVLKEYRGMGYGKMLMEWAMKMFDEWDARHIEVKVVSGNEAIHLYEKYGFNVNAHILVKRR